MICPRPGCGGTVEVRIARGHDEAHCVRCFRCVGLAECWIHNNRHRLRIYAATGAGEKE